MYFILWLIIQYCGYFVTQIVAALAIGRSLIGFCVFFLFFSPKRGEGREKERERDINGCLLRVPNWGPGLQPRHVTWLGIEPSTLCFAGQHSIHWATPARAYFFVCLYPGTTRCSRLILHFPCHSLRINHFSKDEDSLYWRLVFRIQDLDTRCNQCYWSITASRPF